MSGLPALSYRTRRPFSCWFSSIWSAENWISYGWAHWTSSEMHAVTLRVDPTTCPLFWSPNKCKSAEQLRLVNTHAFCSKPWAGQCGLMHVCSVTAVVAHKQKQFSGLLHGAHTVLAGCRAAWCNPSPPEKKTLSKAAQTLDWVLIPPQQLWPLPGFIYLQICASGRSPVEFRMTPWQLMQIVSPVLQYFYSSFPPVGADTHQRDCCSSSFIDCLSATHAFESVWPVVMAAICPRHGNRVWGGGGCY